MRFAVVRLVTEMRSMVACRRGQVVLIFAFAVMMLVIAVGMGIDLWQAYVVKARLQSALDATALAIASTDRNQTPPVDLNARTKAYFLANYPTSALGTPGLPPGAPAGPATPTLSFGATPNIIIVSGSAWVPTSFMRIVGWPYLSVSTSAQAKAAWQNIDFYLLLDDSPSMGIAATAAGIALMVSKTAPQAGCAFGCHETNPAADSLGNPAQASSATCNPPTGYPSGGEDNYALARCLGVQLRTDLLQQAAADLMTTAQTTETANNLANAYRMAIYTFDYALNTILAIPPLTPSFTTLAAAATAATTIQLVEVYDNNSRLNTVRATTGNTHSNTTLDGLASTTGVAVGQVVYGAGIADGTTVTTKNSATKVTLSTAATKTANGVAVTFATTTNNSDADTNYTNAMTTINGIMPNPGQGTQSPGDTPKEVLFVVTDGVEDETVASCTNSATVDCSGNRQESIMNPSYCKTITDRGILIAVLYTQYLPLPTNAWYNSHVSKYNTPAAQPVSPPLPTPVVGNQTAIEVALNQCATPGLYTEVQTGGDISKALSKLFTLAVNAVYLSQ
jgi:hypothetical protein